MKMNWLKKLAGIAVANSFVMFIAAQSVNATCLWLHHQPEVPEELKKFRKF